MKENVDRKDIYGLSLSVVLFGSLFLPIVYDCGIIHNSLQFDGGKFLALFMIVLFIFISIKVDVVYIKTIMIMSMSVLGSYIFSIYLSSYINANITIYHIVSGFIFCIGIMLYFINNLYQIKKENHV